MDAEVRREVEAAVQAVDQALSGLINFMMTLRPTLRNEILQICGHHIERPARPKSAWKSCCGTASRRNRMGEHRPPQKPAHFRIARVAPSPVASDNGLW